MFYQYKRDEGDPDYIKLYHDMEHKPDETLFQNVAHGLEMLRTGRYRKGKHLELKNDHVLFCKTQVCHASPVPAGQRLAERAALPPTEVLRLWQGEANIPGTVVVPVS